MVSEQVGSKLRRVKTRSWSQESESSARMEREINAIHRVECVENSQTDNYKEEFRIGSMKCCYRALFLLLCIFISSVREFTYFWDPTTSSPSLDLMDDETFTKVYDLTYIPVFDKHDESDERFDKACRSIYFSEADMVQHSNMFSVEIDVNFCKLIFVGRAKIFLPSLLDTDIKVLTTSHVHEHPHYENYGNASALVGAIIYIRELLHREDAVLVWHDSHLPEDFVAEEVYRTNNSLFKSIVSKKTGRGRIISYPINSIPSLDVLNASLHDAGVVRAGVPLVYMPDPGSYYHVFSKSSSIYDLPCQLRQIPFAELNWVWSLSVYTSDLDFIAEKCWMMLCERGSLAMQVSHVLIHLIDGGNGGDINIPEKLLTYPSYFTIVYDPIDYGPASKLLNDLRIVKTKLRVDGEVDGYSREPRIVVVDVSREFLNSMDMYVPSDYHPSGFIHRLFENYENTVILGGTENYPLYIFGVWVFPAWNLVNMVSQQLLEGSSDDDFYSHVEKIAQRLKIGSLKLPASTPTLSIEELREVSKERKLVIMSLTTIPPRLEGLAGRVLTMLRQRNVHIDKVVIFVSKHYSVRGFNAADFHVPEELESDDRVHVISDYQDYGPTSKLIGGLIYIQEVIRTKNAVLITVDDDIYYNDHLVENLLHFHKKFPTSVLSHMGYWIGNRTHPFNYHGGFIYSPPLSISNLQVLQGYEGVLYPAYLLPKWEFFVNQTHFFDDNCKWVDDDYLSGMLSILGISIMKIPILPHYGQHQDLGSGLSGSLAQQNRQGNCLKKFIEAGHFQFSDEEFATMRDIIIDEEPDDVVDNLVTIYEENSIDSQKLNRIPIAIMPDNTNTNGQFQRVYRWANMYWYEDVICNSQCKTWMMLMGHGFRHFDPEPKYEPCDMNMRRSRRVDVDCFYGPNLEIKAPDTLCRLPRPGVFQVCNKNAIPSGPPPDAYYNLALENRMRMEGKNEGKRPEEKEDGVRRLNSGSLRRLVRKRGKF